MYRIKLTNGDERTFASPAELASAVHQGIVTAECFIFHQRAGQWLSIATHPHFQRALQSPPVAGSPPAPVATSTPARTRPAFDARDLDRTLELLELLPDPTPTATRTAALAGLDVLEPAPPSAASHVSGLPLITDDADALGARRAAEPPVRLETSEEDPIDPALLGDSIAAIDAGAAASVEASADADVAHATDPEPVSPPAEPPRPRGRSRELDFVYVPERPSRRIEPAPAPAPSTFTPSFALSARTRDAAPPSVAAPIASVADAAPAPGVTQPVVETVAAGGRGDSPVKSEIVAPVPATEHEAVEDAPLTETYSVQVPAREPVADVNAGTRAAPAFDLSPITDAHGGRRKATMVATVALVAVGVTLGAWRPWNGRSDVVVAAAAPAAAPATMISTQAASPAAAPVEAAAVASTSDAATGFGAADRFRRPAQPTRDTAEVVDAPAVDAPAPGVPRVDLGAVGVAPTADAAKLPLSRPAMARNYAAAYAAARAELQTQLAQVGFVRLFERDRLGSLDGLLAGRRAVAEAVKAVKQYRGRQASIEQAYGDTLALVGRRLSLGGDDLAAWDVRTGQRESADAARSADQLLTQLDRMYGLLIAEDGHYQVSADAIVFGDSSAAARYGDLRASIQQRAAGDAPTVQQIARALGGRLPQERSE